MRKNRLLTATALSLTLAAFGPTGQALAATTISTATTAPVKTSTTGDLTVTSAGTITLTSGTAVTVDSDNTVTLVGKLNLDKSADNSTGILINGPHTGDLTLGGTEGTSTTPLGGTIVVTDDFTATDSVNSDTILDGPFASGTGRYGIHSLGASPFIGNVNIKSPSSIGVSGNQSYGIRFENNVQGNFTMAGSIDIEGDNNKAVSLEDGSTGKVYLSGGITVHGTNSQAVYLAGDFNNNVIIDGTYVGSGYATKETLAAESLAKVLATPSDLLQSGVLVDIAGNVDKGIIIGTTQANNVDTNTDPLIDSNVDEDGDGSVNDSVQRAASLTTYGSAPAFRIASATDDLHIGALEYASTAVSPPTTHYALSIRGTVSALGVYSGINAVGVQLGGLGKAVYLANGIQVGTTGAVQANAIGGTATAFLVGSGTDADRLDVDGIIRATGNVAITSTTSGTTTTYSAVNGSAVALEIASGARLPIININKGAQISVASTGSANPVTIAIRDQSDTLTTINNTNFISAQVIQTDNNGDGTLDAIVNRAIAIDTHTNTVGLTLTQTDIAPTDSEADKLVPAPYILGDILLGSGNDTISSSGGLIVGNVDFGDGAANAFNLTNKATFTGRMTGIGSVALNVADSTMILLAGTKLNTTTINVGATSTLAVTLDSDHPTVPIFTGSGAVTFANGATLSLTTNKLVLTPTAFTILTGSSIDLGNMPTDTLDGHIPYLYHADLAKNAAGTQLTANFRLKSQSEAQYSDNQYSALAPVLSVVANDPTATAQLMSQLTKDGFDRIYNQYLPDYSGENILDLSLGSASLTRSLGSLTLVPKVGGQYWIQEYGYHTERSYADTAGFKSTGFSFAGGRESEIYGNQTVGVYLSYTSATPADTFAIAQEEMVNSDVTVGGYWRLNTGAFKSWAHAGVGYANFESTRQSADLAHMSKAKWNGYSTSAGAGASVDYKLGGLGVTPMILADYYSLKENAHSESGGGALFDLTVDERTSHLFSSTAMVNLSYGKSFIKPELWFGYKQNLSAEIANTVSRFGTGSPFTLTGGSLKGGGPIAGFRISADNEWSYFGVEGDYETQENYNNYSIALRTRFQF